jgi:Tol biopolymer transport system component
MKLYNKMDKNKSFAIWIIFLLLLTANTAVAQFTQITTDPADDNDPFWSPDGLELVFWSNRSGNYEIWRIPSTGGVAFQITNTPHFELHPCWSPVDSIIAYAVFSGGNTNIWTISRSGIAPTQVTSNPAQDESLTWNHLGTEIIFDSDRSGNWDLWKIRPDDFAVTQITTHSLNDVEPSCSPDGTIAFRSYRNGHSDIWIIPPGGGNPVQITNDIHDEFGPNNSYQNSYIAYTSNRNGNLDIWVVPSIGGDPVQITTNIAEDWYPHWSPDGTKIAFTSTRSGNRDIWVMDVSSIVEVEHNDENLPVTLQLNQNYPNPFNPGTTIKFSIPEASFVSLKIYNSLGQEIENLVEKELNAGNYKYDWSAAGLTSGIYFYTLIADDFARTKKMILLK